MKKYLLKNVGNFYKANLHVHTTVSDGEMTPDEIKRIYMEKGYSVVAFTDHEVMVPHPELTDEHFVALTSTEMEASFSTLNAVLKLPPLVGIASQSVLAG